LFASVWPQHIALKHWYPPPHPRRLILIFIDGSLTVQFIISASVTVYVETFNGKSFLSSFPSALQLRVSFGLLNNLPPFFSIHLRLIIWFLNNLVFMV
jgi:hypothetical protein